ncbi:nucleotidyl transferase AbiEii/AbiGii toxin family protein [Catellatospora coxensis]
MTVEELQVEVARIALGVAQAHGFALGGGHALNLYGIVHRATEDVDLFTDVDGGVRAAAWSRRRWPRPGWTSPRTATTSARCSAASTTSWSSSRSPAPTR